MKRITLLSLVLLLSTFVYSQEETEQKETSNWTTGGNISLLLNQSSFKNWVAEGQGNLNATGGLNYDFNYKKDNVNWDNKVILAFGISKITGEDIKKSDDRIEINSLLGKKASKNWFYSLFLNFKTQFADDLDTETEGPTKFFSPAYFQFGPGFLWKKSDNLKVNIAPATSKLIVVDKNLTLPGDAYFGVEEGKSTRYELGMSIGGYYKFNIAENVSMENILNLYSNYLEEAKNVDLDYTMNIVMTVNKFLSANISFQTIYDDNAFEGFQIREVFGIGFNHKF